MLKSNIIYTQFVVISWITRIRVVDSDTGNQYIHMLQSKSKPDAKRLADLEQLAIDTTQAQIDAEVAQASMTDMDRLLEYAQDNLGVKDMAELKVFVNANTIGEID